MSYLEVADTAVEIGQEGGGLGGDDRSFPVGAGKNIDCGERSPDGDNQNLHRAPLMTREDSGGNISIEFSQSRQDSIREMLQIGLRLRLGCARGPQAGDHDSVSLLVANDDGPRTDFPSFDEAVDDIRILTDKVFGGCGVRRLENNEGAVRRISKRASENEFTAVVGLAGEAEMFITKRRAASNEIVDDIVESAK